jgi:putative toxin-antitoxin system antitoxin component (TIGR02293 family)
MSTPEKRYSEASRIAQFMGLPRWSEMDDLRLVEKVERGFPTKTAETIVRRIDPKGAHLQVTDIIPKATYHRRKDGSLTKDQSEKILALSRVFAEVMNQYKGETSGVALFLMRPHPLLGGRSPFEVANESTAGADLVLKLLARAEAGVAV